MVFTVEELELRWGSSHFMRNVKRSNFKTDCYEMRSHLYFVALPNWSEAGGDRSNELVVVALLDLNDVQTPSALR